MSLEVGDYVLYFPHNDGKTGEIGRIASVCDDGYFVCYSSGCTSAKTDYDNIIEIKNQGVIESTNLGFNRFNDFCKEYNPDCCSGYCPNKNGLLSG